MGPHARLASPLWADPFLGPALQDLNLFLGGWGGGGDVLARETPRGYGLREGLLPLITWQASKLSLSYEAHSMFVVRLGNICKHSFQSIIRMGTFIRSVFMDSLSAGVERKHIGQVTKGAVSMQIMKHDDVPETASDPPSKPKTVLFHIPHRLSFHSLQTAHT